MNSYLMNCCSDGKVLESYLLDHSNMSTGARVSSHANPRASKVSEIRNSLVSQGFAFHRDMKNLLAVLFIVAALFSPFAACASIKGSIKANSILTDVRLLRPSTRAVLDGGKYISLIRADGQFEFTNLKPGSYLLEIQSVDYIFPKLRVDVDADSDKIRGTYTQYGSLWDSRGFSLDYPFELRAKATANYFTQPQKFNVLGMFKNPMFLMIGVSAVMMLVLPKMMANMDPEMMKEMNQAQTNMPSLTQILSNPQAAAQQLQQMQQQQQQR